MSERYLRSTTSARDALRVLLSECRRYMRCSNEVSQPDVVLKLLLEDSNYTLTQVCVSIQLRTAVMIPWIHAVLVNALNTDIVALGWYLCRFMFV